MVLVDPFFGSDQGLGDATRFGRHQHGWVAFRFFGAAIAIQFFYSWIMPTSVFSRHFLWCFGPCQDCMFKIFGRYVRTPWSDPWPWYSRWWEVLSNSLSCREWAGRSCTGRSILQQAQQGYAAATWPQTSAHAGIPRWASFELSGTTTGSSGISHSAWSCLFASLSSAQIQWSGAARKSSRKHDMVGWEYVAVVAWNCLLRGTCQRLPIWLFVGQNLVLCLQQRRMFTNYPNRALMVPTVMRRLLEYVCLMVRSNPD